MFHGPPPSEEGNPTANNPVSLAHPFLLMTRPGSLSTLQRLNWFVGYVFTGAFSHALFGTYYGDLIPGPLYQLSLLITLVTMAYLMASFLVFHSYSSTEDKEKQQTEVEGDKPHAGLSPLWFGAMLGPLVGLVFMRSTSSASHALETVTTPVRNFILPLTLGVGVVIGWVLRSKRPQPCIPAVPPASKRSKDFPEEYPKGWYKVIQSEDLPKGTVQSVMLCEKPLVVFRGEDGSVGVLDAYCPHMGAHMGAGATVKGNCIACPFHGWEFGADGQCKKIPYTTKPIPEAAHGKGWVVKEFHRQVVVWYGGEGKAEPEYDPMEVPEIKSGEFVYRGRQSFGTVKMHLQDFAENSADSAHFDYLHKYMGIPFIDRFITLDHKTGWKANPLIPYQAGFTDTVALMYGNRRLDSTEASADVMFDGPGGLVHFHFTTPLGKIFLLKTFRPESLMEQVVEDVYWAERSVPRLLVKYVVKNFAAAFKDDVVVWEAKTWREQPILVAGDGNMGGVRRWYKQFYLEDGRVMKAKKARKEELEW